MYGQYIDGCHVELILEREVVRWEEAVRGVCRFRGGSTPTRFVQIDLRLSLVSPEAHAAALDPAPVSWRDVAIDAGAVVEHPFEIRVPPAIGLGSGVAVVLVARRTRTWIPGSCWTPVTLVPSRCFTQVLELTAHFTGLQPGDWHTGTLGDGVKIRLTPEPGTPKRVDAILLELHRASGYLYGQLTVDPVNVGVMGAIKNFTSADLIRFPLRFREGDLDAAAQQLAAHLRPYLDEKGRLPIPSAASAQPEVLPIPASGGQPVRETLPLPAFGDAGEDPKH